MLNSVNLPSSGQKVISNKRQSILGSNQETNLLTGQELGHDKFMPSNRYANHSSNIRFAGNNTSSLLGGEGITGIKVSPAIQNTLAKTNIHSVKATGVKVGNTVKNYGQYNAICSPEINIFKFNSMFGNGNDPEFKKFKKEITEPILNQIHNIEDILKRHDVARLKRAQFNLNAALQSSNREDMKKYLQIAEQKFHAAKLEPADFESGITAQVGLSQCMQLLGKNDDARKEHFEMLLNLAQSDTALKEAAKIAAEKPESKQEMIQDLKYLQQHCNAEGNRAIYHANQYLDSPAIAKTFLKAREASKDFKGVYFYNTHHLKDINTENCDFTDADLSQLDVQNKNFDGSIFKNSNLSKANFHGSSLKGVTLWNANCEYTKFTNCNFNSAKMYGNNFKYTDFSGADFESVDCYRGNHTTANDLNYFYGAKFNNAKFKYCTLGAGARWMPGSKYVRDFRYTEFDNVNFIALPSDFTGSKIRNSKMEVNSSGHKFDDADLSNSTIKMYDSLDNSYR
jgi:uncharacterized protein YjbI with pentapeptide repeats